MIRRLGLNGFGINTLDPSTALMPDGTGVERSAHVRASRKLLRLPSKIPNEGKEEDALHTVQCRVY